ncbi:unnamed protein product [Phytophthora fragariaefolia]|uniref:Unnamed protein product n=1 Tax=Phytophthora fragariaefolia TaxID=1490495 RepID=A0A9W7DBB7_9STRA|nr:unnamed protein product [Phytophthora fragariaefolia]
MVAKNLLGPKSIRPELSGARLDLKGARLSSGTRLINQLIPLAEPNGSLTAEILMDAEVTHVNDLSMDRVQRVAAKGTQCTSVASTANFVSKYTMWGDANCSSATNDWPTLSPRMSTTPRGRGARRPPGPLRAEQFKLGSPPTLTGLDETGLPQSAEPVEEAKYIFAYVGKAGRPERMWTDGNDGIKMDGIDGELDYSKEESRSMISNAGATRLRKGTMGMTKTIKLLPGERLGWWSAQKFDRRVRMRALVMGAVNDQRTKILLDTGANISAINATFARKLRLKRQASRDVQISVQGIGKDKVGTSTRAWVKITLDWEVSYEFEVWVMDHHAGVDLMLGTDFMIPAGIRLDLYNSLAKLPDEVVVPLIKSLNSADDPKGGLQITDGPTETICLPGRVTAEFRARRKQPAESTHELWVRRTRDWIPTVVLNKHGKVVRVLLTSTKSSMTWCPAHFPVLNWAPHGILPSEGFVRLSSAKYRDWQVLAYETAIDKDLLRKERQLYDEWMERQPQRSSAGLILPQPRSHDDRLERLVTRTARTMANGPEAVTRGRPEADARSRRGENSADAVSESREMTAALHRVFETSDGLDGPVISLTGDEDGSSRVLASAVKSAESAEGDLVAPRVEKRGNPPDRGRQTGDINVSDDMLDVDPEKNLHLRYMLAAELDNDERGEGEPGRHSDVYERVPNSFALEDYAHELAFLPDLTDVRTKESITPVVELDETLKQLSPLSRSSARVWIDPQLLYAAVPPGYHDHVLSFHGSATATKNGGYDSRSWIIWRLPSWDIEIAASAHLPSITVNIAEYTGMNNGVVAALQCGVSNLIIVGDARLAIQQSMGVTVCKKGALQVELAKHKELTKNLNSVRYLH